MPYLNKTFNYSKKKNIIFILCEILCAVFIIFTSSGISLAEEYPPPYKNKLEGSAEMGFILTTGTTSTQYSYLRTYAVNERKHWRWYGSVSGSRTLVSDELVSERYEGLLQGDYKLQETDYLFITLGYESDVFNGIRHRQTETLGYGHKFLEKESWESRFELGIGFRHTIFDQSGSLTHVPIINLKGITKYSFTKKTHIEQSLSINVGEDTAVWTSETSLEQAIVKNFALQTAISISYTDNPPQDIKKVFSITRVVLIYAF